jgi:PAS domain S-box-containing protein
MSSSPKEVAFDTTHSRPEHDAEPADSKLERLRRALKASEALKEALLNAALDAVITIDHERRVVEFNPAAERIFGYARCHVLGRRIEELIVPPAYRDAHIHGFERYLTTGENHFLGRRIEISALRSDGSEFPCELTIFPVADGDQPLFTACIRDISTRKRHDRILRQSEERYRTLFNSIDEGFCIIELRFDPAGRPVDYCFIDVNPAFEKQTGLANARGKMMRSLAPAHEDHWFEIYGQVAVTGEPTRFENHAKQLHRWFDVYAFPFGDPAKRQVALLFNDITRRKETEESLAKARSDLEQHARLLMATVAERTAHLEETIAELEGVSYSLSHDMRAPLRTIQSFSEIVLAEAGDKLGPPEKDLLNKSIAAARRLDRLIRDVLTYSRVSRDKIELHPIDAGLLIRQIIDERPEFQAPRTEISIPGPLRPVLAHEAYLTQCITNLLDNAVKFVAPGKHPRLDIWSEAIGNDVRLWFQDNGIGIAPHAHDRIFEIFQRVHGDRAIAGTGIGLAIVRKAVTRMRGSVGLESQPGQGSRFWIQLPAAA